MLPYCRQMASWGLEPVGHGAGVSATMGTSADTPSSDPSTSPLRSSVLMGTAEEESQGPSLLSTSISLPPPVLEGAPVGSPSFSPSSGMSGSPRCSPMMGGGPVCSDNQG